MRLTRRRLSACLVVAALTAVSACGDDGPTTTDGVRSTTTGRAVEEAADFPQVFAPDRDGSLAGIAVALVERAEVAAPVALEQRPGTDDLYVVERAGRVVRLTPAEGGAYDVDPQPVLDISDQTTIDSNRGMVGIAFSEDGGTMYVSHTNADGDSRLASYQLGATTADPASRVEILAIEQPFDDHNIGAVHVGPDGLLWVSTGDGGSLNDPDQRAQDPDDPLGKILRLDPDQPGKPDVYARGMRNPFRFSFDRKTGDLWLGDVGQEATEEIDFLPADTPPGTNFGWSGYEGTTVRIADRADPDSTPPVFEMSHTEGWCAAIGGVVYRGRAIPDLDGVYVFGDTCQDALHALRLDEGVVADERELDAPVSNLVSIDDDADGELWALSIDGGVYELVPAER